MKEASERPTALATVRARYTSVGSSVAEKAVSLFVLNASLAVGFLALGVVRLLGRSYVIGLAEVGISLLLLVSIFVILKGGFKAVSVGTVILFLASATLLFSIQEIDSQTAIYRQTTYMIPVFTTAPLLAYASWQVMLIVSSGSLVVIAQYIFRIRPALETMGLDSGISEFLVALLLTIFTALFTWQTFQLQRRTLKLVREQAHESDERLQRLGHLVARLSEAFNVGAKLKQGAGQNAEAAQTLTEDVEQIDQQLAGLRTTLDGTQAAHTDIENARSSVEQVTRDQTDAINENDQIVGELSKRVTEMRDSAGSRSVVIEELVEASRRASEALARSLRAFEAMQDSSDQILDVISVIQRVSARTNLLAMNAAIEAAHAGDAGRGFAVVAEEIRKLADETHQNSSRIRETLKENQELNSQSVAEGRELGTVFSDISTSVGDVHSFLNDIVASLNELANGHGDVAARTKRLDTINQTVQESVGAMTAALGKETQGLQEVLRSVDAIEAVLGKLRTVATENLHISAELESVGQDNVRSFEALQAGMQELS